MWSLPVSPVWARQPQFRPSKKPYVSESRPGAGSLGWGSLLLLLSAGLDEICILIDNRRTLAGSFFSCALTVTNYMISVIVFPPPCGCPIVAAHLPLKNSPRGNARKRTSEQYSEQKCRSNYSRFSATSTGFALARIVLEVSKFFFGGRGGLNCMEIGQNILRCKPHGKMLTWWKPMSGFYSAFMAVTKFPLCHFEIWELINFRLPYSTVGCSIRGKSLILTDEATASGRHIVKATNYMYLRDFTAGWTNFIS